jgi:methionyl aminopeptidase
MTKINIKTKSKKQVKHMAQGGKKLAGIKSELKKAIKEGVTAADIENLAVELIKKEGGKASFKMVPKYFWATCVNVNSGIVHGIPKKEVVFKKGDVVSVDVGFYYKGFHTDTSFTVIVGSLIKNNKFLKTGIDALKSGILQAREGNRIYDISSGIEMELKKGGLLPIKALVGHGIGKDLHEDPQIPCFTNESYEKSPKIPEGATFAIEVMYTKGKEDIKLGEDGWTISTADGKISALFEETIAVTTNGPTVLTN